MIWNLGKERFVKLLNIDQPTTAGTIKQQNLETHGGENTTFTAGLKWTKPVRP